MKPQVPIDITAPPLFWLRFTFHAAWAAVMGFLFWEETYTVRLYIDAATPNAEEE
jgi:hypothetical protein